MKSTARLALLALFLAAAASPLAADVPSMEFVPQLPHAGSVNCLAVSRNGLFLLTCGDDKAVKLWDARTMSLMREMIGHTAKVRKVAFVKNDAGAVSADEDGRLIAWDLLTGTPVAVSKKATGQSPSFLIPAADGKSFFINGKGGVILKMSIDDLDAAQPFTGHRATQKWIAAATAAALFSGDHFLASGGLDGEVLVRDLRAGKVNTVYTAEQGFTINSVAVSPKNDRLAIIATNQLEKRGGEATARLVVLEIPTWRTVLTMQNPAGMWLSDVQFSRSGKHLVTDGSPILVLDSETGAVISRLADKFGVDLGNGGACISPDGEGFYSLSPMTSQIELRAIPGADVLASTHVLHGIWPTTVSPDGKTLLYQHSTVGVQSSVSLWSIDQTAVTNVPLRQESDWFLGAAVFAPQNKGIAVFWDCYRDSLWHNTNRILDAAGHEIGDDFTDDAGSVMPFAVTGMNNSMLAFSPDGKVLLKAGFDDGRITVHHIDDPARDFIFTGHKVKYVTFAISPDSRRVVSVDRNGVWLYWDIDTGELHPLPGGLLDIPLNFDGYGTPSFGFMPGDGYRFYIQDYGIDVFDFAQDKEPEFFDIGGYHSAMAVSQDGTAFLSAEGNLIRYCARANAAEVKTFAGHRSRIRFLAFAPDGRHFWSSCDDGTTRYWDITTGRFVTFIWAPSQWLVYTDDGFWDGSPNCGDLVAMVRGLKTYGIDQFAVRNNRPDIILQRLGSTDNQLIEHYRNQYLKRLKKLGLSEDQLSFDPDKAPEARIASSSQTGRALTVKVTLSGQSTELKTWNIWVNDVPLFGAEGKATRGTAQTFTQSIILNPGTSRIEAGCMNVNGAEAFRTATSAAWSGVVNPRLYFIGFGVSSYANERLKLNWAAKDARDLAALFSSLQGRGYSEVKAATWTDADVTPAHIAQAKSLLADARPEDTLVLFISGHGVHDVDANATYYYLTYGADIADLAHTTVRFEDIEALLQGVAPRSKLFLMDTCESGDDDEGAAAPALAGGKGIHICTVPLNRAQPLAESVRDALRQKDRWIYNDIARRSGAVVISSCRANEASYEFDDLQNGAFTAAIKACFADPGSDTDRDGIISSQELRAWVSRKVSQLVQERTGEDLQHPTVDRDNLVQMVGVMRGSQ